jgi:glucoamylase
VRRPRAAIAGAVVLAVLVAGSGLLALGRWAGTDPPRRNVQALDAGAHLLGGGQSGAQVAQTAAFRAWLAQGDVPVATPGHPYAALATTALADLHSLTLANGGVLASLRSSWHYVWPRDTAFAAVAFARTGHLPDALRALGFLQQVQAADGSFQARYLEDGSGPPDDRGIQDDAPGWALWSVEEVIAAAPESRRGDIAESLQQLVDRSLQRLIDRTAGPGARPAPSSDYWEQHETRLTLGIAAPTLAGLLAGSRLVQSTAPAQSRLAGERALTLRTSIAADFGTTGYSRYAGGTGPDAAVTFVLPPYVDDPLPGAVAAAQGALTRLHEPGGGLSPGATWPRHDGISWTPETGLFLLSAAETGDVRDADTSLSWFADRAQRGGSLPEKVLPDGSAGDVAPLAWSDALVLIAMDHLDLLGPRD